MVNYICDFIISFTSFEKGMHLVNLMSNSIVDCRVMQGRLVSNMCGKLDMYILSSRM